MQKILWSGLIMVLFFSCNKKQNPYGLEMISTIEAYQMRLKKNPMSQLVDIHKAIPDIVLDIRYATTNNFVGEKMYSNARAFGRKPVVMQLEAVQRDLKKQGLGLKIFDAYRPYAVTVKFHEVYPDTAFVADPRKGSRHNRGAALDLTIIELHSGAELEMPSAYDEFSERALPHYQGCSEAAKINRDLLIAVMSKHGFTVFPNEWWHFDFKGWERFSLMDLSFEELDRLESLR